MSPLSVLFIGVNVTHSRPRTVRGLPEAQARARLANRHALVW
jgi:hypothetical protein